MIPALIKFFEFRYAPDATGNWLGYLIPLAFIGLFAGGVFLWKVWSAL